MTLDTRIYVIGEVDHRELFTHCQTLLGKYDEAGRGPDQQRWDDNGKCISNEPMQNLPGWLMVYHGNGSAYRTPEQAAEHGNWDCDGDFGPCNKTEHNVPCWLEVSIDTAYGYRGPEGMGCGDLHARFVAELGLWLDARQVDWKWRNEFTGDVHEGYESLIGLASGGFEATAWFQTTVLPVLPKLAAREDGSR
ncbi:hypothetical protein ACFWC6_30930 [Micromonospora chalcea]